MTETLSRDPATSRGERALLPLLGRLSRHGEVAPACRDALSAAMTIPRRLDRGASAAREGEAMPALAVVCDGLMLCSRRLPDGLQQHVAIRAPGQVLDPAGYVLERACVSTHALTRASVASISRPALSAILADHPALAHAFTREMASDARVSHEWMVGMGRRSAYARVAHFLCEVRTRLEEVDMAGPAGCPFPLTQSDLADTVGLSVVHTNRVLQQLRREGLIGLAHARLDVRDWEGLVRAGGFDPDYLHAPPRRS